MLYLLCYDIASPKRRKKVADVLLDYGDRAQKSAYECDLKTEARLRDLLARARPHLDPQHDTLRVYRICASCRSEVQAVGLDHARSVERVIIL